jgi:hypothetical protein
MANLLTNLGQKREVAISMVPSIGKYYLDFPRKNRSRRFEVKSWDFLREIQVIDFLREIQVINCQTMLIFFVPLLFIHFLLQ